MQLTNAESKRTDAQRADERPRLLYVMDSFPSLYQGTVLSEIDELRASGCSIHILARRRPPDPHHAAAKALAGSITYGLDLQGGRLEVLTANLALTSKIGLGAYRDAWALAQKFGVMGSFKGFMRMAAAAHKLRQRGFTHLHAHWAHKATELAMILSPLLGLPFSFTCHAVDIFVSPRHLGQKLRAARFVVTVSDYNKRYLIEHYGSDLEGKIHVIYPLVDVQQFSPRLPSQGDETNILSVGRLVEKKGYLDAIEAARHLQERGHRFVWRFVGEGPDRPRLETAIEEHGVGQQVRLMGKMPQEKVKALLDQATVFVLSSVVAKDGDREGMPRVLIEAMAKEVPVVATDTVGIGELVKDGSGLLVPPHDSVALADAIEQILTSDWESRRAMGRNGRRIVEQEFDLHYLAGRLLSLFEAQSNECR